MKKLDLIKKVKSKPLKVVDDSLWTSTEKNDAKGDAQKNLELQKQLDLERAEALSNNCMLRSDTVFVLMQHMWKSCHQELMQNRIDEPKKYIMLPQVILISQTLSENDQLIRIAKEMKAIAYENFHILYAVVHMQSHYSIFVFKNEQGMGFSDDVELMHIDPLGMHLQSTDLKKFLARYVFHI